MSGLENSISRKNIAAWALKSYASLFTEYPRQKKAALALVDDLPELAAVGLGDELPGEKAGGQVEVGRERLDGLGRRQLGGEGGQAIVFRDSLGRNRS